MTGRKEVLDYGMTLPDEYTDTPFHDDNWVFSVSGRIKGHLHGLIKKMAQ